MEECAQERPEELVGEEVCRGRCRSPVCSKDFYGRWRWQFAHIGMISVVGLRGAEEGRGKDSNMPKGLLLMLVLMLCSMWEARSEKLCPGSRSALCSSCPDQCQDSCIIQDSDHVKCSGSSWGNTNSSYMGLMCEAPSNMPPDRFPLPQIMTPAISSSLVCNGTIRRGQWPFDADNMTFTVDTSFRDSNDDTSNNLNSIMLPCMTLNLKPLTSIYLGDPEGGPEVLTCTLPIEKKLSSSYQGLDIEVCQDTDLTRDPLCGKGTWVKVISGACLKEQVTGQMELTDIGGRVLVRVGGAGELTGCQPTFELEIERFEGLCSGVILGFGSCCSNTCFNSKRLSNVSCICNCPPGFVGQQCDKTANHALVSLVFFNSTQEDWFAADVAQIGNSQPRNQFLLRNAVAEMIGLPTTAIEFAFAMSIVNDGTGAGGQDGTYLQVPASRRQGRELLQSITAGTKCQDQDGKGLSRVELRVLAVFEHELIGLKRRLENNLNNRTLDKLLHEKGLPLCTLNVKVQLFNEYGFPLLAANPVAPSEGLSTEDTLLVVFAVLAAVVVFAFVALQYISNRMIQRDLTRHLRTHKDPRPMQKMLLGWKYVTLEHEREVLYPRGISNVLEKGYTEGWIKNKNPLTRFFHEKRWYTADFAQMKAFEEEADEKGLILRIVDDRTLILDANSSSVDSYFVGRLFKITHLPDGSESRQVGESYVISYVGHLRELKLESPIIPTPAAGCAWSVKGSMSTTGTDIIPPGCERFWFDEYRMGPPPAKELYKAYKQWQQDAHEMALYRLEKEAHYPQGQPLPPSGVTNVKRLREIRQEQKRMAERQKADARKVSEIGTKNSSGITTFSGSELRKWQYGLHQRFVKREEEKKIYQRQVQEEVSRTRQTTVAGPLTIDDEDRIADEVFRREVFNPGAKRDVLEEIGLYVDDEPGRGVFHSVYDGHSTGTKLGSVVRLNQASDELRLTVLPASPTTRSPAHLRRGRPNMKHSTPRSSLKRQEEEEYSEEVAV